MSPGDSAPAGEPLYAETVSPNQNYVEDEKDVVRYTVQIYQDADGTISVRADSNSAFFEQLSYDVPYHRTITEENIRVEWLTLAGGTEPTESDQIALAAGDNSLTAARSSARRNHQLLQQGDPDDHRYAPAEVKKRGLCHAAKPSFSMK